MRIYTSPRASTGLIKLIYELSKELPENRHQVVLPANICYTFPLSVILTGWDIRFVDVDKYGWVDLSEFLNMLRISDSKPGLIVVPIPYGNLNFERIDIFREKLRATGFDGVILWDMALVMPTAQVLNWLYNELRSDEVVIFSFSYAKPISLGYGAVLLTEFKLRTEFDRTLSSLEAGNCVDKIDKLYRKWLSKVYRGRLSDISWLLKRSELKACYMAELRDTEASNLKKLVEDIASGRNPKLNLRDGKSLPLTELIEHKLRLNELYREKFKGMDNVKILDTYPLSWRFNLLFPDRKTRDSILNLIFSRELFASRLFPVLPRFLHRNLRGRTFNGAGYIWERVLNLFNEHFVDTKMASKVAEIIVNCYA